jgi:transcriptional regulator with XRE-family HTH domain
MKKDESLLPASEMTLGQRLKYLRKKERISQREFAEHAGISQGNLSDMENDKYLPSITTVISIIEYYGFAADWILFGIGPMQAIDYSNISDNSSPVPIAADEEELLSVYNDLDSEGKAIVKSTCYQERRRMQENSTENPKSKRA